MDGAANALYANATNDRVQSATTAQDLAAVIIDTAAPTGDQEITGTGYKADAYYQGCVTVRGTTTSGGNYYAPAFPDTTNIELYRVDNGTFTLLTSAARANADNTAHTQRFKATGTSTVALEFQLNATAVITYNDTNASRKQSGRSGVGIYQGSANQVYVDTISVDNLSAAGVSGTISVTLSSFVSSIASTKTHVGTIGVTLASFISSIAGKSTHVGTIGVALSNFISTITGSKTHVGSISQTLSNFVSAITGGSSVSGTIAATLSNFVSSISGKIGKVGTIASTLSNFISSISGTVSGGTGVGSWLVRQIGNKLKFASRYLTTSIRRNRNNG